MNLPVTEIKTLLDGLARNLCNPMESGDREKVLAAQKIFTETIVTLWNGFEESEVDLKIKSIGSSLLIIGLKSPLILMVRCSQGLGCWNIIWKFFCMEFYRRVRP